MTVDFTTLFDQAEVLDEDDVAELKPARKSTSKASELVRAFNEREEYSLFIPASLLGERNTLENGTTGTAPHDLGSLRNLAGQARDYARENDYEVNTIAVERSNGLGLLVERRTPDPKSARGRKAKDAEVAEDAE